MQKEHVDLMIRIATVAVTILVAIYNHISPSKQEVRKEQLTKVYLPAFRIIEPYLYKSGVSTETMERLSGEIDAIIDEHYELVFSELLQCSRDLRKELKRAQYVPWVAFEDLCRHVDFTFDRLRRSLGLPTRGIIYRVDNRQYPSSTREAAKFTLEIAWMPMALILTAVGIYSLLSLIQQVITTVINAG